MQRIQPPQHIVAPAARPHVGRLRTGASALLVLLAAVALLHSTPANAGPPEPSPAAADQPRLRTYTGRHLTLVTDVVDDRRLALYPALFDRALELLCQALGTPPEALAGWRVTGCVMGDRRRFYKAGLLPADAPADMDGFIGRERFWIDDDPEDYYRRHLMLHEATHLVMHKAVGGTGPPWFAEGMAERFAMHAWSDANAGGLELGRFPLQPDDVPRRAWIEQIQKRSAAGRPPALAEILALEQAAFARDNAAYGWSWAAVVFLASHPRWSARFGELLGGVRGNRLTRSPREVYGQHWPRVEAEFALFVDELDFGYDFARAAIDFAPSAPLGPSTAVVEVAADRGWQNTGLALEAHHRYRLRSSGRYVVAGQPRPWWCEPDGVTLRYYRGVPLGKLMVRVLTAPQAPHEPPRFTRPVAIGREGDFVPDASGTLLARINDAPGELGDNSGVLRLSVEPMREPAAPSTVHAGGR